MAKKVHKDPPRYKAILGYENDFKKGFSQILGIAMTDVKKSLKKLVNSQGKSKRS